MKKTIAAVYATRTNAETSLQAILDAGVLAKDVSVLSHQRIETANTVHTKEGDGVSGGGGAAAGLVGGAAGGALAALGLAAIPGVGWVLAAGPVASMLTSAAVGGAAGAIGGGLVGAMTDNGVDRSDAEIYAEAVRRGGTVVLVYADDTKQRDVERILREHRPLDLEKMKSDWHDRGWTSYDAKAKPLRGDDLQAQRRRWSRDVRPSVPPEASGRHVRSYRAS